METGGLSELLTKIPTLSWWGRLFRWRAFAKLAFEAHGEHRALQAKLAAAESENARLIGEVNQCKQAKERVDIQRENLGEQLAQFKATAQRGQSELLERERRIASLEKEKDEREHDLRKQFGQVNQARQDILNEKEALKRVADEDRQRKEQERKETWKRHEKDVEERMRALCKQYNITYVEGKKVPFRGNPDNTVVICDEHIIFDAKSPQTEDLGHFEKYIKVQAEAVKKYAKQEGVKKDIFLVVPTNAIEVLREKTFHFANHQAFVIAADSLGPILLSLQKIEEYEFAEKLSPEDRQAICTVVGKMVHGMKRRMQVDQYFARESIALLHSAENMPKDILQESIKAEKAVISTHQPIKGPRPYP